MLRAVLGGLFLWAQAAGAQELAPPQGPPLFASNEPVALRLVADLEALKADRASENPERASRIQVEGAADAIAVDVRTRGNFRLRPSTCPFPPLRLDFPRSKVAGTLFEGQDKLKLVTYCRDRDSTEQDILEEYLAYRLFNELSDWSFRVRLARVTYVDELAREDPVTRFGFLIEDDEAMAQRLGGAIVETPLFDPRDYDASAHLTASLFQFMIGNTDWSIVEFHNAVLLKLSDGRHVPVFYDFDFSGLVDAPYAEPNPTLGIKSVKDRLYRGFCTEDGVLRGVVDRFLAREEATYRLVDELVALSGRNRGRAKKYLGDFFDILRSEARRDRHIVRSCRSMS
ncbi:MAG: hypothetical protein R3E10_18800 [Gemmatimonadota bacterium]